jgi:hypothetical protein
MKSDIGSAIMDLFSVSLFGGIYQDDLRTPGTRPSFAASLKQARHMPKSRIKARFRPQRKHRLTTRDLNFGVRVLRAMVDFFAISKENRPPRGPQNIREARLEVK